MGSVADFVEQTGQREKVVTATVQTDWAAGQAFEGSQRCLRIEWSVLSQVTCFVLPFAKE
jgi:hypothetical protein